MTALKRKVIQLVEQMPEERMSFTPKMRAFLELEKMLVPVSQELDYDKELSEARNEKYGYIN